MSKLSSIDSASMSRRGLLGAGAGLGVTMALAACGGGGAETGTAKAEGSGGPGQKRSAILAFGGTAPWAVPISAGAKDACDAYGWEYTQLFAPGGEFSEEDHVNTILQAVNSKPDVILTADWYKPVTSAIERAQNAGIFVACVNAFNFPEEMEKLEVEYYGPDERNSGKEVGERLATMATENGNKSGTILMGNPFAASTTTRSRAAGVKEAVEAYNAANGTKFTTLVFEDQATVNIAESISLYGSQLSRLGDEIVAHAVIGGSASLPALLKAIAEAGETGEVPIGSWDSDEIILGALKKGEISFFKDQGNYYQGLLAVSLAWSSLERYTGPLGINTEAGFIEEAEIPRWTKQNEAIAKVAATI